MTDAQRLASYDYGDAERWPSRTGAPDVDTTLEVQLENLLAQRDRLDTELEKIEALRVNFTEARRITELRILEIRRVVAARRGD